MKGRVYQLSARLCHILLAISEALVTEPPDLVIHDRDGQLIARMTLILREFPRLQRLGFVLGILFFDYTPFLFGYGMRRFVHLTAAVRQDYVQRWLICKNNVLREVFKGIRGLVLVCYFSHTDIWKHIGYDPFGHVTKRIQLRRELTGQHIPDLQPTESPASSEASAHAPTETPLPS